MPRKRVTTGLGAFSRTTTDAILDGTLVRTDRLGGNANRRYYAGKTTPSRIAA